MGGLLLPAPLVFKALERYLTQRGVIAGPTLDDTKREAACLELAEIFDVNPVVVRLRLKAMFPPGEEAQLTL
jgi:hypothetical protein